MLPPEILSQRPPPLPGQSAAEQAKHLRAGLTYLKVLVGSTYGDDPATPDVLAEIQALIDS